MKSIISILIVLSAIQVASANPFEVNSVIGTPHLNPGDHNIEIQLLVQNTQIESLNNVKVHLFLNYPFSATTSPNNMLGELTYPGYLIGAGGSGDEYTEYFDLLPGVVHKTFFKIDVDRNAKYGIYDLPYTVYYEKGEFSGKISLSVTGNTLVEIRNISMDSNNSQVEPGDVFKVYVSLENVGDNSIKWLKLTLDPNDKSLIPLSSDSERVFKDVYPGSQKTSEFVFSLDRESAAKNYPVNILLSYMDEKGDVYNETKLTGIAASGRASLDIAKKITEPARVKENEPFILTLKIENTGTGNARGVEVNLESSLDGDTLAYLGEIKKDDYSNAIFILNPAKSGKNEGNLRISYEDDFGKHEVVKEINLLVYPGDTSNPVPIVLGLVISASALFFWKKRKT